MSATVTKAEEWRDVPGFEGRYAASNLGAVKSLKRVSVCKDGRLLSISEKLLKPTKGNHSYLVVSLWKNNSSSVRTIHTLIAETFIGIRPAGYEVCHCDGNCENNAVTNLRYDTVRENRLDTVRHGRSKIHLSTGPGEKNPNCILSETQAREIKTRCGSGESLKKIWKDYPSVSYSAIKSINQGKAWAHI